MKGTTINDDDKLGDIVLNEDNLATLAQERIDFGVSDSDPGLLTGDFEGDFDDMEYDDDYYDEYDPWSDPDWEPPCDCWCELCGCHGYCMEEFEGDDYDEDEDYDREDYDD